MQFPLRLCEGGREAPTTYSLSLFLSPIPPKYTTGMGHAPTEEGASHMRYCIPLPAGKGFSIEDIPIRGAVMIASGLNASVVLEG